MKKVLAVALLDWRRLAFGLTSAALVAGLLPSLANGLGAPVETGFILAATLLLVGAACGGYFGTDFSEGRSSYFFARPLPTWALITGRAAALLGLAGIAFLAFMASNWISSTESQWTPWILDKRHAYTLGVSWSVSLFVSLGIAARARDTRARSGLHPAILIPLRLSASLAAFFLMFGLFADLIQRAYSASRGPVELFLWSWAIACLVASFVAISAGRTERLRIARLQGLVMVSHFVLVSLAVIAAWSYVLHPDADAIQEVSYPTWGSQDGRTAFLSTRVNRGSQTTFRPIYVLDIASGQAKRLNADRYQGPWTSANGSTVVWSEATPFFFRPLWRGLGGETTFRVRDASGQVKPLPMPKNAPDFRSVRDLSRGGGVVNWVLPSPDGDVFAITWGGHLTFTSHSRGELSDANLYGPQSSMYLREALFLPTGDLRPAFVNRDKGGEQSLDFMDIEPTSGARKLLLSVTESLVARIRFDADGARALITTGSSPGRGASVLLVHLDGREAASATSTLVNEVYSPSAAFVSDGRIVASGAAAMRQWDTNFLTVFSPGGEPVLKAPVDVGFRPTLAGEMFPGVMAVSIINKGASFIDLTTGKLVRSFPDLRHLGNYYGFPPEGSAAARLLLSTDGKLYELPSLDAEPRLLLPTRP